MSLESSITFFIAIFIFSITPGPGVFAIIARSLTHGVRSSFPLCVGMALSDIVYLVMACYGLAAVATTWEEMFLIIRYVGAAYLIYLGWKMWTVSIDVSMEVEGTKLKNSDLASFTQGFMISASNPKVILFYVAFLPTFMDLTVLHGWEVSLAAVLAFIALLLGLTLIAVCASQARRYMKSESSMKMLNRCAGGIMVSAGAYLGLKS